MDEKTAFQLELEYEAVRIHFANLFRAGQISPGDLGKIREQASKIKDMAKKIKFLKKELESRKGAINVRVKSAQELAESGKQYNQLLGFFRKKPLKRK